MSRLAPECPLVANLSRLPQECILVANLGILAWEHFLVAYLGRDILVWERPLVADLIQ